MPCSSTAARRQSGIATGIEVGDDRPVHGSLLCVPTRDLKPGRHRCGCRAGAKARKAGAANGQAARSSKSHVLAAAARLSFGCGNWCGDLRAPVQGGQRRRCRGTPPSLSPGPAQQHLWCGSPREPSSQRARVQGGCCGTPGLDERQRHAAQPGEKLRANARAGFAARRRVFPTPATSSACWMSRTTWRRTPVTSKRAPGAGTRRRVDVGLDRMMPSSAAQKRIFTSTRSPMSSRVQRGTFPAGLKGPSLCSGCREQ